jgi:hypothetical protein
MNKDEKVPVNCIFCGSEAVIVHFDRNMWYVHCSSPFCKKHDKYAYLGSTKDSSIEQWNYINRNIDRTSTKTRKKKDESSNI